MDKRKLTFSEMCKSIAYYDFFNYSITKTDGTVVRGTMYKLDRMLTDTEKKELKKFGNVRLFVSQCQYAPEIKTSCIFLAHKVI
jgi:hypothetical protein